MQVTLSGLVALLARTCSSFLLIVLSLPLGCFLQRIQQFQIQITWLLLEAASQLSKMSRSQLLPGPRSNALHPQVFLGPVWASGLELGPVLCMYQGAVIKKKKKTWNN